MKHRWNKGKKGANVLPNGDKIIHLKVGGRTSAVVPNVQKKTGPVAGDVKEEDFESDEDVKPKKAGKGSKNGVKADAPPTANAKRARKPAVKEVESDADSAIEDEEEEEEVYTPKATPRKRKSAGGNGVKEEALENTPKKVKTAKAVTPQDSGRRRSGRGVN
jgi:formamidopyrimidine-DNA glycosylase